MQNLKKEDLCIPMLSELEEREIPVAESLIQYNVERGVDDTLQIIPGEDFAFSLNPCPTQTRRSGHQCTGSLFLAGPLPL